MKRTIIFLMALTAALGTATLAAALKISSATEKVIRLKAKKFEFTPGVITVKKGEPLVLDLTSADRTPGFNRPNFGIQSGAKPGTVSRLRSTPDKAGGRIVVSGSQFGSGTVSGLTSVSAARYAITELPQRLRRMRDE